MYYYFFIAETTEQQEKVATAVGDLLVWKG